MEADEYDSDGLAESAPLSDTATLRNSRKERLQLQDTFRANFDGYLPYVIRRQRVERAADDASASSQETVASFEARYPIMGATHAAYRAKLLIVLVSEFMKLSLLVFASRELFALYRHMRGLDKAEAARRWPPLQARGLATPLLKIENRAYRRLEDGADMVFHRYASAHASAKFATVHIKGFAELKRFCFTFYPPGAPPFTVAVYQHNSKPIADFDYRHTRFRVFGNLFVAFGLVPNFKLLVVDAHRPSLTDTIVDRPPLRLKSIIRRRSLAGAPRPAAPAAPAAPANPYPADSNPLMRLDLARYISKYLSFISNDLPPFGSFQHAATYLHDSLILPKRYKEQGCFEVYQATPPGTDLNANPSVNLDTLVLCCVTMALREGVERKNSKVASNLEGLSRYPTGPGVVPS
jgi:hypothetical protein